MPVSNALRRLLQVRELEEEQHKAALESALGDLRRLESALRALNVRERAGRTRTASGTSSPDPADRMAGLVEAEAGRRAVQVLTQRISAATARSVTLRAEYLARRVERRQVDTVIHEAEELETIEQGRRQQHSVDEWFGVRCYARASDRSTDQLAATDRLASEKHEIKNGQESPAFPEAELRFDL